MSNRSGSPYSVPRDANHVPFLVAASTADGVTPVVLEADPTTHLLQVSSSGGGGGGTQYTDGAATIAHPIGTIPVYDNAGTITAVSVANPLPVSATISTAGLATSAGQTTGNSSLSTIVTDVTPFVTSGGGGYIRQDSTATIAKESGGNLATIATNTTSLATSANQTNGTQQSKITNGTNVADVVAGDSGSNGMVTAASSKTYTFTTSSSGAQTLLANTPVGAYASIEVVYTSTGPGLALTGQFSPTSGGTYVNSSSFSASAANSNTVALGVANSTIYYSPVRGNYFQIAVSALTSGTFTGTVTLRSAPLSVTSMASIQSGTWTVQPGNTANTTAWLTAGGKTNNNAAPGATNLGSLVGIANAAAPTWTEGNEVLLSTDLTGNLRVWNGSNPVGTALNTYSVHLTSNTTTTPTSSTAYISSVSISSEVAGTTSTVTIQDKQGTPLKLVNGFSTTTLTTTPTVVNFQTPVKMVSGIDIITAGAVAATIDVWVNYYQ